MSPRTTTALLLVLAIGVPALIIGFAVGVLAAPLIGHYTPIPLHTQLPTI